MPELVFLETDYNQLAKDWLAQGGQWHGRCPFCNYARVILNGKWFCRCRGGYADKK
jgi:hypothetical protein